MTDACIGVKATGDYVDTSVGWGENDRSPETRVLVCEVRRVNHGFRVAVFAVDAQAVTCRQGRDFILDLSTVNPYSPPTVVRRELNVCSHPQPLPQECIKATRIFKSFVTSGGRGLDKVIPHSVLQNAKGFVIFTVVKAGFVFSARAGSGLVIARLPDGSFSAPSAIGTAGMGFGGQAGAELTDFLIVLNSRSAIRSFMSAGSLTLGGNMSLAVGPLGRNGEALGALNTKGKVAAMYSYSKTKGLFGGVSVEGSVIVERQDANAIAYNADVTAKQLLSGSILPPHWADGLIQALQAVVGTQLVPGWIDDDQFDSETARPSLSRGYSFTGMGSTGTREVQHKKSASLNPFTRTSNPSTEDGSTSSFTNPDLSRSGTGRASTSSSRNAPIAPFDGFADDLDDPWGETSHHVPGPTETAPPVRYMSPQQERLGFATHFESDFTPSAPAPRYTPRPESTKPTTTEVPELTTPLNAFSFSLEAPTPRSNRASPLLHQPTGVTTRSWADQPKYNPFNRTPSTPSYHSNSPDSAPSSSNHSPISNKPIRPLSAKPGLRGSTPSGTTKAVAMYDYSAREPREPIDRRLPVELPEIPPTGPRPKNYLRSQKSLLGVAGLVSNISEPREKISPTGTSIDDPIPIDDTTNVADGPPPKKRGRFSPPSARTDSISPAPSKGAPSFAELAHALRNDMSVTTRLQALLNHLTSSTEADKRLAKRKRVDATGRVIPEEEWRFMRTQELIRQLSTTLRRSLQKAGLSNPSSQRGPESGSEGDLQAVIQQWLITRLTPVLAATPSTTPGPSTPSSSVPSTVALPQPINEDGCDSGFLPQHLRYDDLWDNLFGSSEPGVSINGLDGLGITLPPSESLTATDIQGSDPSGSTSFGDLETLLGLCNSPPPVMGPTGYSSTPLNDLVNTGSTPNSSAAFSPPGSSTVAEPVNPLPLPFVLDPALATQAPIQTPQPVPLQYPPHVQQPYGYYIIPAMQPLPFFTPNVTASSPQCPNPGSLPVIYVPPNPPAFQPFIPPEHFPPAASIGPGLASAVAQPTSSVQHVDNPHEAIARTTRQVSLAPPTTTPAIVPNSSAQETMDIEMQDAPTTEVSPAVPNVPRKTTRVETVLTRARERKQKLQEALDKARLAMWDLEIEEAMLSKVVKNLDASQGSSSRTFRS
ncbi:hypothetical protein FRB99_006072 [Tulasnella sp. 403]|nr:hypothetical protein FRB99_006072 [Tulasnella sp. 403]